MPLPLNAAVRSGALKNGVHYLIEPLANTSNAARLELVVKAGSLDEEAGERGFAHLVEHIALDPSQRFGALSPAEFLASVGASSGADSNAETHYAHTRYYVTLPNAQPELVDQGLDALMGWASQVAFTWEALERQRPIVLAELRDGSDRQTGVSRELQEFLTAGLGYAGRHPLGDTADLAAALPRQLRAFYERWYTPANFTVIAIGALDPSVIQGLIERRFAQLAGPVARLRPQRAMAAPTGPDERWLLGKPRGEALPPGLVLFTLQLPSPSLVSEQLYRTSLIDEYLCALLEERWARAPQRSQFGPRGASCTVARPGGGQVQLRTQAWSKPGASKEAVEALLLELQRLRLHGVLESELLGLQAKLDRAAPSATSTTLNDAARALMRHATEGEPLLDPARERELRTKLLGTITPAVLLERAREWLERGRRVLAVIPAEDDTSIPSEQALAELAHEVRARAVSPPEEPEPASALMASPPLPGSLRTSERVEELGVTIWTLENGATVVFKPGREGAAKAALRAVSARRESPQRRSGSSSQWNEMYAPEIIEQAGAGGHDARALARLLGSTTVQLHLGRELEASSSSEEFETALQLLHLYLTSPRRDTQAFQAFLLQLQQPPPPALVFARRLLPDAATSAEITSHLNLDEALQMFRERFGNARQLRFVIVADLAEARARSLAEQYLASLPGGPPSDQAATNPAVERTVDLDPAEVSHPRITRVRMGGRVGEESHVVLRFEGTETPTLEARTDFQALEIYLGIRLREELRERLGGIHDVQLAGNWSGNHFWREIRFDCKPQDVDALRAAALAVIRGIEQPGVSAAHIKTLRARFAARFPAAFQSDAFWLEELSRAYAEGSDPRGILALPALEARMTRENLRRAARLYLPLESYVDGVWAPGQ